MALRTINAPGVEIKEVDKSDYSTSLTGSNVLVTGYANRGQDFITNQINSRNTWLNIYGTPENEAERYFFKASMEVIENGGILHCAKIPYVNAISSDYVQQIFTFDVNGRPISADSALSTISDIDPSIQKFFVVSTKVDTEQPAEAEIVALIRAAYAEHKEEIDQIILDLKNGGSAMTTVEAAEAIINILGIFDASSRSAQHAKMTKIRDASINESSIDIIKKIMHENLLAALSWDIDSMRDMAEQRDWFANLKFGLDEAKKEGEACTYDEVKETIEHFTDAIIENLPISYHVDGTRKAKSGKKDATLDDSETNTSNDQEVVYDGGADSTEEVVDILVNILQTLGSITPVVNRTSNVVRMTEEEFEKFETGEASPEKGKLHIIDISRTKYGRAIEKNVGDPYMKECLGYMPVITTAANALYCQQLLDPTVRGDDFNVVSDLRTMAFGNWRSDPSFPYTELKDDCFVLEGNEIAVPMNVTGSSDESYMTAFRDSITMRANSYFPGIFFDDSGKLNREHLKEIGIVVFKTFINRNDSSKIDLEVVESFVGNVDPKATNPSTNASTFIDNIVNNQSDIIRCYSNVVYDENRSKYNNCDVGYISSQPAGIHGIYEDMLRKNISLKSITKSLDKVFDANSDVNAKALDIVVDAGISNIGMFVSLIAPGSEIGTPYEPCGVNAASFKMNGQNKTASWKMILEKFDAFCRKTRKDCMFVADCPRPFALTGHKKTVREGRRDANIDTTIIPLLRYMGAPNTSYGAGYSNWFEEVDEFSGNIYWCPPSIRATGVYINCDVNYNYWDAPAGLTRGLIPSNDVAFNPNISQAGNIYLKNWNYAIKYPDEGIVLEGQKTFQTRPSAFDRVNVRRLFLRLERFVYRQARYFVYEPNTALTRQRLVDRITPYFKEVQSKGGMYDFRIICDETVNTPETIDRNELRLVIGIKPTKTIEFILIQFVALRTGGSWEELDHV